jgi:diaminopimelate decarboxylase
MFNFKEINFFKSLPTPFYYYQLNALSENIRSLKVAADQNNVKIHYALKANNNNPVLAMIRSAEFGADCVSGPEIQRALENGFDPSSIVFAGVGKTDEEISLGLKNQIACFNCESVHELEVINKLAFKHGCAAPVALRINPDFYGQTHTKITTGTRYDKFGIPKKEINETISVLKQLRNIRFRGLHFHIGSQITNLEIFSELAGEINRFQDTFIQQGLVPELLNLGGGLGVDYESPDENPIPDYDRFFKAYFKNLNRLPGQEIYFELGRSMVAQSGSLISKVLYLKKNENATYAIIDAGMNDFMRPALYGATHKIQHLSGIGKEQRYHIAGPVCESSDIFGKDILLSSLKRGDLISIRSAGAYGEVMTSGYNLRKPAQAIYSNEIADGFILKNKLAVSL